MNTVDINRVLVTGENPFIRLSETDSDAFSTNVSFWRVLFSPGGPGHVLFMKSELTGNSWRIWSDNIGMTRWLQATVQGMLNPELTDVSIPVTDATFSREGDPHYFWTERASAIGQEVALTWHDIGDPLLVHSQPYADPKRQYGLCTVLVPARGARVTLNGVKAKGSPWPREREGRPFSTCALAFAESWTELR
jgi:hypothetical protein